MKCSVLIILTLIVLQVDLIAQNSPVFKNLEVGNEFAFVHRQFNRWTPESVFTYTVEKVIGTKVIQNKRYEEIQTISWRQLPGRPEIAVLVTSGTLFQRSDSLTVYFFDAQDSAEKELYSIRPQDLQRFARVVFAKDTTWGVESTSIEFIQPIGGSCSHIAYKYRIGFGLYLEDYNCTSGATDRTSLSGVKINGKNYGSVYNVPTEFLRIFQSSLVILPSEVRSLPRQRVTIGITFIGAKQIAEDGSTVATTSLSFNATLLEPLNNTPRGEVVNGVRTIPVQIPLNKSADTVQVALEFVAALGNADSTVLTLGKTMVKNPNVIINQSVRNGIFRLNGVNTVNGEKGLFYSNRKLGLITISPNPIHSSVKIGYSLQNTSEIEITLTSITGVALHRHNLGLQGQGNHETELNISNEIPAGRYILSVRAGQEIMSKIMVRIK
jgi:hypothetical protein